MHKKVQNFDFWPIFLILSTWMWCIWWILMRWDEMGLYEFIWDEFTWDEFKRLIKLTSQVVANLVRSLVRSLPIKASYSSQLLVELYLENDRMPGSGGDHQISVTALRISMKLGNYLGINILRKVTEPFFRKNVLLLIKKFKRAFLGTLCFLNFKLR